MMADTLLLMGHEYAPNIDIRGCPHWPLIMFTTFVNIVVRARDGDVGLRRHEAKSEELIHLVTTRHHRYTSF